MRATPQLQRALRSVASTALSAGPSRPIVRLTPRLPPLAPRSLAVSYTTPRLFSTSSSQRQDQQHNSYSEYTDAPEGYSKSTSSRSQKPWYRSPTTLVLGFIPIFTFGLGYWQIKRLKWKVALIEELEDKLSRDPLRLPRNINIDVLPEFDFRLVSVRGTFDHARTMFVGPRVREGVMGYHVVVPFRRSEGGGMVLLTTHHEFAPGFPVQRLDVAAYRPTAEVAA